MKNFFKRNVWMAFAVVASISLASCSSDDDDVDPSALSEKEQQLQQINTAYVKNVVINIYSNLADKSMELDAAMAAIAADKTDANVAKACELWKSSRQYWEWSEAFLYGAAANYGIDPHIDTWPLDKAALDNLLSSEKMMSDIENTVKNNLNNGLVGYHALEFIIFREGKNRPAANITADELRYAVAVAEDLTVNCCRLEASWAGFDNVDQDKQDILEDAEIEFPDNFGEQMELAGFAGSIWKTVTAGSEQIIEGCKTIVDEVGNSKIGRPHTGEDINYIESPHAYNSIQDFEDNIVGVQYALYGAMGATSAQNLSIMAYLNTADPTAAKGLDDALKACIAAIQAMPKPFVEHYTDAKVQDAIEACDDLNTALITAQQALRK